MQAREQQAEYLCDLIIAEADRIADQQDTKPTAIPITMAGYSFKPETNLTTGSPAILMQNILLERGYTVQMWDPYVQATELSWPNSTPPPVIFIGTKHPSLVATFGALKLPTGSVIIDPHRFIPDIAGAKVIRVGE